METKALKGVSPLSSSKQQNKPFPVVLVIGIFSLIMLGGFLFMLFAEVPVNGALSPILDKVSQVHPATAVNICNEASLQNAISSTSPGGTITFSCSGTITLTSQLVIDKDLTLDGSGQTVTLDGQNSTRIMTTTTGINLTINSLTFFRGYVWSGAGINNSGHLTINNSTFSNNIAGSGGVNYGGGIYNTGTLNVNNSTFTNNSSGTDGGGIYSNSGSTTITNSTFSANSGNTSTVSNYGTMTVSNSTISNNSSSGLFNEGNMTVNDSTISNNSYLAGSGIFNEGNLIVNNSTISGNSATENGGGVWNYRLGKINITNSTISGNSAGYAGGGIYNKSPDFNLVNTTVTNNTAGFSGGGIYHLENSVSLKSSLLSNNTPQNCLGAQTDQGYNLEYTSGGGANTCGFTNNAVSADPLLDPAGLQNNGGLTKTIALLSGSPASSKGSCSPGSTDQRGIPRKNPCDIGAYESNPSNPLIVTTGTGNGTGSLADALQQAGQLNSPVPLFSRST